MAIKLSCPSCGYGISLLTKSPQIVVCPACNTTSELEHSAFKEIGKFAFLADSLSRFDIGTEFRYGGKIYKPVGRVRYDYGKGYWDEWYVQIGPSYVWISEDEGDIAFETEVRPNLEMIPPFNRLAVGKHVKIGNNNYVVAEKGRCRMVGCEGELPFKIIPNEEYDYVDLLGKGAQSYSIEYESDKIVCFSGKWIDPFDIEDLQHG